jgi:hypothetical protein
MYLTKSRFKIGISCPTKLYYAAHPIDFHNNDEENEFMQALSKGGLQVGELAKLYYPGGIEVDGKTKEIQLKQTNAALKKENVIIYEAAILVGHKFIRVDILEKRGNNIKVIEVKSKSCDGIDELQFFNKRKKIATGERPYLEDIAFQLLVVKEAFPDFEVTPFLMMPNKRLESSIDCLYSYFVIEKKFKRDRCTVVGGVTKADLGTQIMTAINVQATLEVLVNDNYYREHNDFEGRGFKDIVNWFSELLVRYENNGPVYFSKPFTKCRDCEYNSLDIEKSGFYKCLSEQKKWSLLDFEKPKVWDVWGSPRLKYFLNQDKWFMEDINVSDLTITSRYERQSMQIENTNKQITKAQIDTDGLRSEIENFRYPLNLIDFETVAPAIPFFKGYKPYQGLCFQFSHHLLHEDGMVEHKSEYLGMGQGTNPSFEFIESLYNSLIKNDGDVFMYSHHENTYLNYMILLLWKESPFSSEKTDRFISFLQSLTKPSEDITPKWEEGSRKMIDMAEMVRSYYWHPDMKGSNSIKQVLPAIMNDSAFIQNKYSKAIYGKNNEVKSLNFENHKWVVYNSDNKVLDPYKNLPDLTGILPDGLRKLEHLYSNNKLADGGAAMTAWAFMQFGAMGMEEKKSITSALKRYCELDTMAMVIIMEAWRDMVDNSL